MVSNANDKSSNVVLKRTTNEIAIKSTKGRNPLIAIDTLAIRAARKRLENTSLGKLIKTFKKSNPLTFQDWLLVNESGIPIASGVYLIHVDVPDVGERIIKSFIGVRTPDFVGF